MKPRSITLLKFTIWVGTAAFGVTDAAGGQAQPAAQLKSAFEVASIRPGETEPRGSSGIHTKNGRLDALNVTLKRCIMGAYGLGPHQIIGGPDWIHSERFQISAKADDATAGDHDLMAFL